MKIALLFVVVGSLMACRSESVDFKIIETYPHSVSTFTQGLELHNGELFESSGLYGKSYLVKGPVGEQPNQKVPLPENIFAEGLTVFQDHLYVLSWRSGKGMVFSTDTLAMLGEFQYPGEGWGLCNDGVKLIMSDGTDKLRLITPGQPTRVKAIQENGKPVDRINELECVGHLVLANQWQTDDILVIDPSQGEVVKRLNLSKLFPKAERPQAADVLNGIAWDEETDTFLVTGKLWPTIYRVELNYR